MAQDDKQRHDSRMGWTRDQVTGKRLAWGVTRVLTVLALGAGGGDVCVCACVVVV